jgi:glucose-6-phosphate isomerase
MLNSTSPQLAALSQHAIQAKAWQLTDLFQQDPQRAARMTMEVAGLTLDYSKNHLQQDTLNQLFEFARSQELESLRAAMFRGEPINLSEQRSVLHTLLRAPAQPALVLAGEDLSAAVQEVLSRMAEFCEQVRAGSWTGYTGLKITDVVNIGIGGSDLGPAFACAALRPYVLPGLNLHFLSNVDGHAIDALLPKLNPQTTLFIVASKTFTTQETLLNAHTARRWFLTQGSQADLAQHFVAVSTNTEAVQAFGIQPRQMFPFWDWVGGRYSVWSAIGLSLMLAIGPQGFREFLDGAHAMDVHFRDSPLDKNMPVLMGLTGFWYRQFFNTSSVLVAPYHQDLHLFPAYLQQLEMESNGKSVTRSGAALAKPSAPVVWGSVGTNGQHAYFQLLHQGTDIIPVDFITCLHPAHSYLDQHQALLANCFAQSEALMQGRSDSSLAPHRRFAGNRPSNMLLMERLTPSTLGALLALYEHKTFVQGVLWNINSFDQWGVELGKTLAQRILDEWAGKAGGEAHDSSTQALMTRARQSWD